MNCDAVRNNRQTRVLGRHQGENAYVPTPVHTSDCGLVAFCISAILRAHLTGCIGTRCERDDLIEHSVVSAMFVTCRPVPGS